MIILKILGVFLAGLYCFWLAIGLIIILQEIFLAILILLVAPLKGPNEEPPEHVVYIAPLGEQIKLIPEFICDLIKATATWITLPFEIIWALLSSSKEEEQAVS